MLELERLHKSVNQLTFRLLFNQILFRKSFTSSHPCYYIKTKSGSGLHQKYHYLYADSSGRLRSSGDQPIPCAGHFKFTKNLDGSFNIYSMAKVNRRETLKTFANSKNI
jgi:hypothetical protein